MTIELEWPRITFSLGGPVVPDAKGPLFGMNRHGPWQIAKQSTEKAPILRQAGSEASAYIVYKMLYAFATHGVEMNDSGDALTLLLDSPLLLLSTQNQGLRQDFAIPQNHYLYRFATDIYPCIRHFIPFWPCLSDYRRRSLFSPKLGRSQTPCSLPCSLRTYKQGGLPLTCLAASSSVRACPSSHG